MNKHIEAIATSPPPPPISTYLFLNSGLSNFDQNSSATILRN